jgi:hypothetical protein
MSLLLGLRKSKWSQSAKSRNRRLNVEALEDRCMPSTFYAATASALIADIKAANLQGGANTIALTAPTTSPYVMTTWDTWSSSTNGMNALPVIAKGDNLTILTNNGSANPGFGDTIDAGKHGRLFNVASGASLTLEHVTLQNGQESYASVLEGGAIFNQGTLVLSQVMVQNNGAVGKTGLNEAAAGGGIWSNGSLTVENGSVFQGNLAQASPTLSSWDRGGNAYGGAIYIAGGTANISGTFFGIYNGATGLAGGNTAQASGFGKGYGGAVYVAGGTVSMNADTLGQAGPPSIQGYAANTAEGGGSISSNGGYGGALYVAAGSVTLTNDSVQGNWAGELAYFQDPMSYGWGGGIYIASGAQVYLDSFTLANTQYNFTPGGTVARISNIVGSYILLP